MAVRYKKFGKQEYAYRIWNEKNTTTGKWRQRSEYLGVVVDKENRIFEKRRKNAEKKENQILEYGDSYYLNAIIEQLPVVALLGTVFKELFDTVMALVFHRIIVSGAMYNARDWYDGNYVSKLFPNANMTSQNISKILSYLGEESVQRAFFDGYIPLVCPEGTGGVVIDSTGLPNDIHMPITDWGHHNGGIEYETRLILAVERETEQPLYFRYVAGNIGDVSTLTNTIAEMKYLGITTTSVLLDAGYFSETNLRLLFGAQISFLIRMPSNRVIYREIILNHPDIESGEHAVIYNKRALFVKEQEIDIYGHKAFAYLVLDPERRGREISNLISKKDENKESFLQADFSNCGKMVLLSYEQLEKNSVVPLYYTRQIAERMFGIAKDDLSILPLRTHSEPNFRGFMFLVFVSLILSSAIKKRLENTSVDKALSILKSLKCKVYNNSIVPYEVNKRQRLLFEDSCILVPNVRGI